MHTSFRVVIAGAGLGGLVLAHGLAARGLDVAVYERDAGPETRHQGYRIQLDEPGITGLRRCLPESLWRLCLDTAGAPPSRVSILNPRLDTLTEKSPQRLSAQPQAFDRATLRRILIAGLGERVHFGARLHSYRVNPAGSVTINFDNGRRTEADLLVGADGVSSRVRSQLLPDALVGDAGLRLIYGKIDLDGRDLVPPWVFESIFTVITGGPGNPHVGVGPVEPVSPPHLAGLAHRPPIELPATPPYLACLVGAPVGHPQLPSDTELRTMSPVALKKVATDVLASSQWHPDIDKLIAAWHLPSLMALRVTTSDRIPVFPAGPVTLVGDAIHPMSPVLAMGANTAIRDAAQLSDQLASAACGALTLAEALDRYHRDMNDYAGALVTASRHTGQTRVGQR